ncbi:conserved hypothetical protein [Bosea sp. 62]|uniref:hypothetical protein n=1 Tax=unclassified Bosea (in: a-proteobacteria) TaxID=2653178 RepID=UPI00125A2977|nr:MULTISPECIES: hypothetical protein [unclassified Bosea (in: a-proteobacteria)]CAD5295107.1 conserved hypothetical protein [Bosea sp. 21B]CAD5295517.1 conserved hypothetical protein [Bosea sp. 46]CAD5298335.1 conserved hypothetical protein [Bosea sp. 7B]VVT60955.1 conserved hypothetical protein [Bosea sp. EC-HK365B]VXB34865.1 conserved hypothetical protein [Bosea sp. 127]
MSALIIALFRRWQVDEACGQCILGLDQARYHQWKYGRLYEVDDELAFRLALLFSIHTSLCTIFMDPTKGYHWMRHHNLILCQTPIAMIASGDLDALRRLQTYLAAEAQGW